MKKKKLGHSDLQISAIGFGCMGISHGYGTRDDAESMAALRAAFEGGVNFFDTADMYGAGHNEEIFGRVIAGRRAELVIATKCGFVWDENGVVTGLNGRPEYIRKACEASLRRLRIETIDLYYLHRIDPQIPVEESIGEMSRLVAEGKVRFLGLSEAGPEELRRAFEVHPVAALQSEYSLWARAVEKEIIPLCRELNLGFIAYGPLGSGFLTGRIKSPADFPEGDLRRRIPRFEAENFEKNLALVRAIEKLAAGKNCSPAQLAIAWVLAQGEDLTPIPGTKRRKYLRENLGALEVALDPDELKTLDRIFSPEAAVGALQTDKMKRMTGKV
jgi:aryl-alcohol dehydrogenase-like predicted oxidoreductase